MSVFYSLDPTDNPTLSPSKSPISQPSIFPIPERTLPPTHPTDFTTMPSSNMSNMVSNESTWRIAFIAMSVLLLLIIIFFVCIYLKLKRDHQSENDARKPTGILANNKDLDSILSGSPVSIQHIVLDDDRNGNKDKTRTMNDSVALDMVDEGNDNKVEIRMSLFNTPGNLIDGKMQDLDVDDFEDSDHTEANVITKGELSVPEPETVYL